MKAAVDPDACAGHGACVENCPEVFRIGGDGYAEVLVERVPVELEAAVQRARVECPTGAIAVSSD